MPSHGPLSCTPQHGPALRTTNLALRSLAALGMAAASIAARARAALSPSQGDSSSDGEEPIALAGGRGASTIMSHLDAEHSHGRGLLGFMSHGQARYTLAGVCRELRREVAAFRWPPVVLEGHTGDVSSVCALINGRVVSASYDRTLRVWNAMTGACERVLAGHTGIVCGVCSLSDGRLVSASSDRSLRVWSVTTGVCERVLQGHTDAVWSVCAPTDDRVVSGSHDTTLRVWNISTGACEHVLVGQSEFVSKICALANGRFVFSSSDALRVWGTATGACERVINDTHIVKITCILSDNNLVVDLTLGVWNASTGVRERAFNSDLSLWAQDGCTLPDGRVVYTTRRSHTLRVWNVATAENTLVRALPTEAVHAMCALADGRVAIASAMLVRVWQAPL